MQIPKSESKKFSILCTFKQIEQSSSSGKFREWHSFEPFHGRENNSESFRETKKEELAEFRF